MHGAATANVGCHVLHTLDSRLGLEVSSHAVKIGGREMANTKGHFQNQRLGIATIDNRNAQIHAILRKEWRSVGLRRSIWRRCRDNSERRCADPRGDLYRNYHWHKCVTPVHRVPDGMKCAML